MTNTWFSLRRSITLMAIGLSLTGLCATANADNPALTAFSPGTTFVGDGPWTLGWDFTTNSSVTVTKLGFFDDGGDGLIDSHQVGIWDTASQTLLASGTVTSADPLVDGFRYVTITPLTLNAGTQFSIGATIEAGNNTDAYAFNSSFTVDPAITYDGPNYISGSGLNYPLFKGGFNPGYFGPNFQIGAAAVPEPGEIATGAILFASLAVGIYRGRRSRKS